MEQTSYFTKMLSLVCTRETAFMSWLKTANAISIPLTVGGGIRSLDDISKLLESGGDKVS